MQHHEPQNDATLNVHAVDVAEYILRKMSGFVDAMKLQKLCYYAQAWSLAWGRGAMFPEEIEAWDRGPVVRSLFARHKGMFSVQSVGGNADIIARDRVRVATIRDVLNFYGHMTGDQLSELAHSELPWQQTRAEAGARDGQACDRIIPRTLIGNYYRGLMREELTTR